MSFLHRLFHQVLNQFLVDALANSRTFQRFAVKSNQMFKDLSKNGLGSVQDFGQAFSEEFRRNLMKEGSKKAKSKS